uniref:MADF domain-containing protein n=2 Tax=Bombyx mori TaxID=7091 RepID=A0A8R2AHI6_BOMMO|nr:uncharacterized protein LOC101741620 isoform X3 [Bombyx mori]
MCDIELLISLVKQHQCIWNVDHEDYHNPYNKEQAWKEICKEMCENWDKASPMERKRAYMELKKKWNNVRDSYRKDVMKSQALGRNSRRYIYAAELEFMERIFLRNKSVFETINCESIKDHFQDSVDFNSEYLEEAFEPEFEFKAGSPSGNFKMATGNSNRRSLNSKDDDTLFLLSLRGYMKEMTREQKLHFKISILNLIKDCS